MVHNPSYVCTLTNALHQGEPALRGFLTVWQREHGISMQERLPDSGQSAAALLLT